MNEYFQKIKSYFHFFIIKKSIFYLIVLLSIQCNCSEFYVTCSPHFTSTVGIQENVKARFGNQLLAYIKALWAAEKYNIPYLHQPIDNEHLIKMGSAHPGFEEFIKKNPKSEIIHIRNFSEIKKCINKKYTHPIIFQTNSSTSDTCADSYNLHKWKEMRENSKFIEKLRDLLSPIVDLDIVKIPENFLSVAIHMRKGGGYDLSLWSIQYFDDEILRSEEQKHYNYASLLNYHQDLIAPLKSPPEQYYLDQLKKILELYPNQNIYVHLFTDDPDPAGIIERMQEKLSCSNSIIFNSRFTNNSHDANVLEDLLSLLNFDIFIRTLSSYSVFAHILGKHKLIIFPKAYKWVGQCLTYTDVIYEYIEEKN